MMFHHKKGSQIGYSYPGMFELGELFEEKYEEVLRKITTYALPDAVPNTNEDYMYFTISAHLKKYHGRMSVG